MSGGIRIQTWVIYLQVGTLAAVLCCLFLEIKAVTDQCFFKIDRLVDSGNLMGHSQLFYNRSIWHGHSLAVQWLGLGAFTAGARVQSLVGELRSRKPHDVAKKKKNMAC